MGRLTSSSGGRLGTSGGGSTTPGRQIQELNPVLLQAQAKGLTTPKRSKVVSALQGISRVLNIGVAPVAGAVRGLITGKGITTGIKEGTQENIGYADALRSAGFQGDRAIDRFAVGAAGFVADVLFDPMTYLTFGLGAGLKVGEAVLSKTGTKVAQSVGREATESLTKRLIAKGMEASAARTIAEREAARAITRVGDSAVSGLTPEISRKLAQTGVSEATLAKIGPDLIDKGGIKFAGRTLVSSARLADTAVGKAARRLGESEVVRAIKEPLGKMFKYGFNQNPELTRLLEQGNIAKRRAVQTILDENSVLFKGLSDKQMTRFFNVAFEKKKEILTVSKQVTEDTVQQLKNIFPELRITDRESAGKLLATLEDDTVKRVTKLRSDIDEIVAPMFRGRQQALRSGKALPGPGMSEGGAVTSGGKFGFSRIDEMNKTIAALRKKLKELRGPATGTAKSIRDLGGAITGTEISDVGQRILRSEEERLMGIIDKLATQIEKGVGKPVAGEGVTQLIKRLPKAKELSMTEKVVLMERTIVKLQNELGQKAQFLQRIMDSRRIAKARQAGESILPDLADDPRLQKLAVDLFEGDNAVVKRLAKEAGLSEQDAIKFYLPSIFKDKMTVKDWAQGGKLSSVDAGYLKEFKGVETPELVRDPFKALSTRQIQVAGMNIKHDTAKAVIDGLGVPLAEMSEKQALANGLEKFSRTFGAKKIEGWLPKDIIADINKFIAPEFDSIDKLAKSIGFDYATGLWKSYVTGLFPAFHIRNATSNVFQNMLKIGVDAVNPFLHKNATLIALGKNLEQEIVTKTGKTYTLGELRRLISKESDILEQGAFGGAEMLVDEARMKLTKPGLRDTLAKVNPLSRDNIAIKAGTKVGHKIENEARLVNILSNVMEGKSITEAIKVTEEALFNYGKLTDFERKVMRRLIPFYSFARFNMGLQLSALTHTPGRVAAQLKGIRGASNMIGGESLTEEDKKGLPSYVLQGLGIKAGANQYGQNVFLTGFGLPIEQFLARFSGERSIIFNVIRNTINELNPILKYGEERALDIDTFRDRPIAELDNAQDFKSMIDSMPGPVAKEFKELIGFVELPNQPIYADGKVVGRRTVYRADPYYLHFFRNLPTGRVTATIGMATDETQPTSAKWLRLLTGVRATAIDQKQQEFYNDLQYKGELEKWLTRMGFGKIYSEFYQPKAK